jgi:manganese-dependent ADP-ribose/CDP-alcohol diphosphatase
MKKIVIIAALQFVVMAAFAAEPFKFGVIADPQYCDCDASGSRYYRESLSKLDEAVEKFNAENVRFTITLGDIVDRDAKQNLAPVLARLARLDKPVYHSTGNHDYWDMDDYRWLHKKLGMPATYYAFSEGGWRFIVLNTNEVATYTSMAAKREHDAIMKKIERENRTAPMIYSGGIGKKQMRWLKRELKMAERKGENVLVFSHHPLCGPTPEIALNGLEIVELLSKYPDTVQGTIAGHMHEGDSGVQDGMHFITVEGMITGAENAFGLVTLHPDRIEFEGHGRVSSHTIPLRKNEWVPKGGIVF